jgi:hypothetical protein
VILAVNQIAMMPLMIMGAAVCPKGVEGALYAVLMSLTEIGGIVGDVTGTALTAFLGITNDDFTQLWLLILLCNLYNIIPLCFVWLVPSKISPQNTEDSTNDVELSILSSSVQEVEETPEFHRIDPMEISPNDCTTNQTLDTPINVI